MFELKGVQVNDDISQTNNIQTENCFVAIGMQSLCPL